METVKIYTRTGNVWTITNGTYVLKESTRTVEFSIEGQKMIIPLENIDIIRKKD